MEGKSPRIAVFASGKGGTGKSLLAANIGIYLATLGKRVVLVDASFGTPCVHLFIGAHPKRTLAELLGEQCASLRDLVEPTPVPGLQLIAGDSDPPWVADPRPAQVRAFLDQLAEIDTDHVLVDLGPGTSGLMLDVFLQAHLGIVVTTPEATSVAQCHRFLRAAFLRRLRRVGLPDTTPLSSKDLRAFEGGAPSPRDLYERACLAEEGGSESGLARKIEQEVNTFTPALIVNCARSKGDMELGASIASATHRRMGLALTSLGFAEYDEAVSAALRRQRPLMVEHPESRAAKSIERVARKLLMPRGITKPVRLDVKENYYELFGVTPTSTFEEIRRANQHARQVYAPQSMVVCGLYSQSRLEALHRDLDRAYATLMDANRRKEYDAECFPEGMPGVHSVMGESTAQQRIDSGAAAANRPAMPTLGADTLFTGALLRQIREATGANLRDIAQRSKIGMSYLEAIEEERFGKLPAPVYVRGFLMEYAKALGIDPERVSSTYLERVRSAKGFENAS